MGQGQPGVQREERDLDGKAGHEGEEDPGLLDGGHLLAGVHQCGDVKGPGARAVEQLAGQLGVEPGEVDDAGESQNRAGEGVEEELDCRGFAVGGAEQGDEHEHGHERELEHDVEQDGVACQEDAGHDGLKDQKPAVVGADAGGDGRVAGQHADGTQEGGEGDQGHRQAVDTQGKADTELLDPGGIDTDALGRADEPVVGAEPEDDQRQRHERADEGDLAHRVLGHQRHEEGGQERGEQQGQQHELRSPQDAVEESGEGGGRGGRGGREEREEPEEGSRGIS